ncbi:FAD-dependent oxidoreductase [Eggerthella sp. YY7918]|uniref:FAD-dependent oxidoreductase n=1 Tax=Eggerthella sp. (strain YY7918) TaxID=502558 RepID=UPI0002171411|nr:FAD-dependent oxidoreductase [Eggerthella sp. YY7918]BAK45379.1 hypothetical protein EGYY_23060 [Eggerthella sp. YY7918]
MKNTIDRRHFIGGSAVALAAVGALGLAGCGPSSTQTTASGDKSENEQLVTHAWENPPEPIAAEDITETVECDVVIVGAGTAGVTAACSAAEAGAKTVLIEKSAEFSARGHDLGCVDSRIQKEAGIVFDKRSCVNTIPRSRAIKQISACSMYGSIIRVKLLTTMLTVF